MEPLSHYCPSTPATRVLNENPELNTVVHNIMLFLTQFFAEMLFAIAVSEPRECLLLQQWNQVNTDTKRTCHNAHIIQVSILSGLSENNVTNLAQKYASLLNIL